MNVWHQDDAFWEDTGPFTVFGNLDGDPYDHKAQRLVILAQKPDR